MYPRSVVLVPISPFLQSSHTTNPFPLHRAPSRSIVIVTWDPKVPISCRRRPWPTPPLQSKGLILKHFGRKPSRDKTVTNLFNLKAFLVINATILSYHRSVFWSNAEGLGQIYNWGNERLLRHSGPQNWVCADICRYALDAKRISPGFTQDTENQSQNTAESSISKYAIWWRLVFYCGSM